MPSPWPPRERPNRLRRGRDRAPVSRPRPGGPSLRAIPGCLESLKILFAHGSGPKGPRLRGRAGLPAGRKGLTRRDLRAGPIDLEPLQQSYRNHRAGLRTHFRSAIGASTGSNEPESVGGDGTPAPAAPPFGPRSRTLTSGLVSSDLEMARFGAMPGAAQGAAQMIRSLLFPIRSARKEHRKSVDIIELLENRGLDTSRRIKMLRHQDQRYDVHELNKT